MLHRIQREGGRGRDARDLIEGCRRTGALGLLRVSTSGAVSPEAHIEVPEELFGWRAPGSWHGAAIVLEGRARTDAGDAAPVRFGALALRNGLAVAWGELDAQLVTEPTDPIGLVPDTCRRAIGLPSDPSTPSIAELANVEWLSEVLHRAADPETRPAVSGWDSVAALHPAAGGSPLDADELVGRILTAADDRDAWWELHRRRAGTGAYDLGPTEVAWMDAPMFARWAIGCHRRPAELIADLSLFMPSHRLAAVCAVVIETMAAAAQQSRNRLERSDAK